MLDTVRGKITRPWVKGIQDNPPFGWKVRTGTMEDSNGIERTIVSCSHEQSGMYIKGDEMGSHVIQVSLPRLLHGDNTNLIKNQDELDMAFSKMRLQMLDLLECDAIPRWTRLDMVWNFKGNISEFIAIFNNTKHPRVRSAVRVYGGESISWKGKRIEIQIYDKLKEKGKASRCEETIVRAEVRQSVTHDKLHEDDPSNPYSIICEPVHGGYLPTFEKCYDYYRKVMVQLSPKTIPEMASRSPLDFLAYLQANNLTDLQGVPLVDLYLAKKSRSSKYRLQRELKARVLRHKFISWHALLPEESIPKPITYSDVKVA